MSIFLKRGLIVAVNLVILCGLGALMEFGVRAIQARRLGPKAVLPNAYMDRWTAWRNAPNWARIDIHHNAQGFRHDADVAVKPPGAVRIFFGGGSAAYGCEGLFQSLDPEWQRLYNRDLIDAYLEKILRRRHPERQWEVINVATNEFRMHQHLALFYTTLLRYRPDLILFMDGHNDLSGLISSTTNPYDPYAETPHGQEFEAAVYPHTLRDWFFVNAQWLRNASALFRVAQAKVLAARHEQAFGVAPDAGKPVHSPVRLEDLMPALQQRARENIGKDVYYTQMAERLHAAAAHEKIEVMFALQPELILSQKPVTPVEAGFADYYRKISGRYVTYMYENMRPDISRQMAESAAQNGYTYTDLVDTFRHVKEKTFTDYCHLTPKGNELIAERLYQAMAPSLIPKLVKATGATASARR
jgi:lysophospholipase L1-like esterase